MVLEALGCNLLDLLKMFNNRGLPVPMVKCIAKQVAYQVFEVNDVHDAGSHWSRLSAPTMRYYTYRLKARECLTACYAHS